MTLIALLGVLILAAECRYLLARYLDSNPIAAAMLERAVGRAAPICTDGVTVFCA